MTRQRRPLRGRRLIALAGLLARLRPATPLPDAARLIRQPEEAARLERLADGAWRVCWTPAADARLYAGPAPEAIDWERPLASATGATSLALRLPDGAAGARLYVGLHLGDGPQRRRLVVAERRLRVPGVLNFRDVGGYATADGGRIAWGRLYRAGDLARLSPDGRRLVRALGPRLICDLRTSAERRRAPNRHWPDGVRERHLPVHEATRSPRAWLLALLRHGGRLDRLWRHVYFDRFVVGAAPFYGRLWRLLADADNLPAVVHCTAGKDRTGVAVALLLLGLGVDEATVLADYSLSNQAYAAIEAAVRADAQRLAIVGLRTADLFPVLSADPALLAETLAALRRRYGSVRDYLRYAGVDDATWARVRANLVVAGDGPPDDGACDKMYRHAPPDEETYSYP